MELIHATHSSDSTDRRIHFPPRRARLVVARALPAPPIPFNLGRCSEFCADAELVLCTVQTPFQKGSGHVTNSDPWPRHLCETVEDL